MNSNASLQKPTWCALPWAQTLSDLLILHLWLLWKGKSAAVLPKAPSQGQRPNGSGDAPAVREML